MKTTIKMFPGLGWIDTRRSKFAKSEFLDLIILIFLVRGRPLKTSDLFSGGGGLKITILYDIGGLGGHKNTTSDFFSTRENEYFQKMLIK